MPICITEWWRWCIRFNSCRVLPSSLLTVCILPSLLQPGRDVDNINRNVKIKNTHHCLPPISSQSMVDIHHPLLASLMLCRSQLALPCPQSCHRNTDRFNTVADDIDDDNLKFVNRTCLRDLELEMRATDRYDVLCLRSTICSQGFLYSSAEMEGQR